MSQVEVVDNETLLEEGVMTNKSYGFVQKKNVLALSAILLSIIAILIVLVIIIAVVATSNQNSCDEASLVPRAKNLIFMVTDGYGPAEVSLARQTNGSRLFMDSYLIGSLQTVAKNKIITDSAAGATVYSCGLKTNNRYIAVDPDHKPCGTILEAAIKKGMKTGIVVTSRLTDATPASFSSHVLDRGSENNIADQQISKGIQVLFGGGIEFYSKDLRSDGVDAIQIAINSGYSFVSNTSEFNEVTHGPVLGIFNKNHMSFEIDRDPVKQPYIKDMVNKALNILNDNNENGFFLLVEGSRIDHASHSNDPVGLYHDIISYNDAFSAVIEFAKKHGDTLVLSTSDHETGGLSLARGDPEGSYPYEWYPETLLKVTASVEKMAHLIADGGNAVEIVEKFTGFTLTQAEIDQLNALGTKNMNLKIAHIISARVGLSWGTAGHSSVDVNLYGYGPRIEEFGGHRENFEIGLAMANMFEFNLEEVTEELKDVNINRAVRYEGGGFYGGIHD